MTASVQNLEPAAAYLPALQSNAPLNKKSSDYSPDHDGAGAADPDGEPADFRSELEMQHASSPEAPSANRRETRLSQAGAGKAEKKPVTAASPSNDDAQDPTLVFVAPVQGAEPQKIILPITLMFGTPEPLAAEAPPEKLSEDKPDTVHLDAKLAPYASPAVATPIPVAVGSETPVATADKFSLYDAVNNVMPNAVSDAPAEPQPAADSASNGSQPISQGAVKLPVSSLPEPVPAPAVQETSDSEPPHPAVLAFAARLAATPPNQKSAMTAATQSQPHANFAAQETISQENQGDAAASEIPSQTPAAPVSRGKTAPVPPASDSPVAVRIPPRYAGVAPILPKAEKELDPQVDLRKYSRPALDRSSDSGAVLARVETTTRTSTGVSQFQAPPPQQFTPRTEHVIEPPAAPATSPHDIRVRVPDNNGGSTQVRFVESGGEVRVSVRTADAGLAQNLRTHLNDLSQRLADGGTPAEMWKPASEAAHSQKDQHQPDRDGRGSGGQHPGSQSRQQDRQEQRPRWLEEMEASLQDQNT